MVPSLWAKRCSRSRVVQRPCILGEEMHRDPTKCSYYPKHRRPSVNISNQIQRKTTLILVSHSLSEQSWLRLFPFFWSKCGFWGLQTFGGHWVFLFVWLSERSLLGEPSWCTRRVVIDWLIAQANTSSGGYCRSSLTTVCPSSGLGDLLSD